MTASAWDPAAYARFRHERAQPLLDLMALVRSRPDMRVADLGCGTGEMTRRLHDHLGASETLGIDSSASMLAQSRQLTGHGLQFRQQDIKEFAEEAATGQPYDLIFSNAAPQWLPDHAWLLERLTAALTDSGQLALQIPANEDHPSQAAAADVVEEPVFRDALGGYSLRSFECLCPEEYSRLLHTLGYREQHVRLQVYGHVLQSRDDVVEWMKGTLLTAYQQRLSAKVFDAFVARYRQHLLHQLEDTRPYFFPFKRILLWAQR